MRVAGLAPVDIPGIENHDVTKHVPGHMSYRTAMPRLLREVGWIVDSDEFVEIEDPDPDNHEKRQRELINEIEEARKELEKKPEKKRYKFFGGGKKKLEKKEWEMYEEKDVMADSSKDGAVEPPLVLFDVDAIRKEVAELAAEGIEVKEIESTLPPMKLDLNASKTPEVPPLRETKSYNDSVGASGAAIGPSSTPNLAASTNGTPAKANYYDYDEFEDGEQEVSMTFDTSYSSLPAASSAAAIPTPEKSPAWPSPSTLPERPVLKSANTTPAPVNLDHNAWADDDDEFAEKEIKMTFA